MAPHCSTCFCQPPPSFSDRPALPDAVNAYITSNVTPSASDSHMLREYRLSLNPYRTRLENDIVAMSAMQEQLEKMLNLKKAALDALRTERRVLEEHEQSISGALSPLRRLPLEVLQEIFLCTLRHVREHDFAFFDVSNPNVSPWTLRRVCRKWRTATECPHLWTGLLISPERLGHLSILRDVLKRSRSLPLRFSFFGSDAHLAVIVFEELAKHSERWQCASFCGVGRPFIQPLLALRGRLPKLEALDFRYCSLNNFNEDGHPFEIAPSLTKASLYREVVKLDYSRLESFTSHAFTPTAVEVLVSSHYLTYLADHYHGDIDNEGSSRDKPRYLHSRLNTLLVKQCVQLNMLTLPNLEHLEAGVPSYESSRSLPIISQFLHVSQCPLLSLILEDCDLSSGSMPELLQLVPRLQSLSIHIRWMERNVATSTDEALNVLIKQLTERSSNEFLLVPKLRSFVFKSVLCHENPWHFMDTSIVDMVRVRPDMESVSFSVHPRSRLPNLSDDDIDRLRTMKKNGANVSIVKMGMEYGKDVELI